MPAPNASRTRTTQAKQPVIPDRLELDLRAITRITKHLSPAYRQLYEATYSPRVGESAHVQAGKSDPTAALGVALVTDDPDARVAAQARSEHACMRIEKLVREARNKLAEAESVAIRGIPGWQMPPPRVGYKTEPSRSVAKVDLHFSEAAQAQRAYNGEIPETDAQVRERLHLQPLPR